MSPFTTAAAVGKTCLDIFVGNASARPMPDSAAVSLYPPLLLAPETGDAGDKSSVLKHTQEAGDTPLHIAVRRNRQQDVLRLLALKPPLKVDINAANALGNTPLHIAAANGESFLVQALLEAGADPLRINKQGLNAIFIAAYYFQGGLALDIINSMPAGHKVEPSTPDAAAIKTTLDDFRKTHPHPSAKELDTFCAKQIGLTDKNINSYVDIYKYFTHINSIDGYLLGDVASEGWFAHNMLVQRLRSLCTMVLQPAALPDDVQKFTTPAAVEALLCQEIATAMAALQVELRRLALAHPSNENCADKLSEVLARQIHDRVVSLADNTEFCLPDRTINHQVYLCMHATQAHGTPVLAFRLDNLGGGCAANQSFDGERRKVSPLSFNVPVVYLKSPAGRVVFCDVMAQLMRHSCEATHGMDYMYAALARLQKAVSDTARDVLHAPTDEGNAYVKAVQSVGNCSFKNYSMGMWARLAHVMRAQMGAAATADAVNARSNMLWHFLKQQEQSIVRKNLLHLVETRLDTARSDKKVRDLRALLKHTVLRQNGGLERFFADHPDRTLLAAELKAEDLEPVVREGDESALRLLTSHGLKINDRWEMDTTTLLHVAVVHRRPSVMAWLLAQGVNASVEDVDGLTAQQLAAKLKFDAEQRLLQGYAARQVPGAEAPMLEKVLQARSQYLALLGEWERHGGSTVPNTPETHIGALLGPC